MQIAVCSVCGCELHMRASYMVHGVAGYRVGVDCRS